MHKLIKKLLSTKKSSPRIYTLLGLPGIGKSSMAKNILHYIDDRSLLTGGSIYINASNITDCEVFLRIFNTHLITENPVLFSNAKELGWKEQQSLTTFNLILSKINVIDEAIVLVIDDAEELIRNDKNDFKMLISMMLKRVPHLKVLLTSTLRLTALPEFIEDIIILKNLNNLQSAVLFKSMTREIR